jgi:multiple sugar transport system substrate-binding protein
MMRRSYMLVLLAVCVGLGGAKFFSSGNPFRARKTRLNFWNGWTGPDGTAMLEIIRRFNVENPDIEVSMQRMDWDTYYNKLMVSTMSGRGPQVFVIHASTLPRMFRAGFIGDVSDMYSQETGILRSDFESKVLNQVKFGKEMIAVPLDIHPQGLYCNKDLLLEAGLKNPDGTPRLPRDRAEFLQTIRATQKIDSKGQHEVWGFSWTVWRNNFMTLLPQFHGGYFDKSGKPELNCPGNVAALAFMGDLTNSLNLTPSPESNMGWVGYQQKKVAMVWEGVYMVGNLQTLDDFHYIGGVIPRIGSQNGTVGDSHCLCIRKDLSPIERSASERFITYLSSHSLEWAQAGQVPARISIRNEPAFKKLQVQYAFSKEVPYLVYPPRSPLLFELEQEIDLAVEKVLRKRATAQQALDVANENLEQDIVRDKSENGS